jgi:hypothetical protein
MQWEGGNFLKIRIPKGKALSNLMLNVELSPLLLPLQVTKG